MATSEQSPLASGGGGNYGAAAPEPVKEHHGENSAMLTAGIIVADVVGAGILSMAVAIAKFGWLLGSVLTVLLLGMNVHVSIIVWRIRMRCENSPKTYLELAEGAFARQPEETRRLAVKLAGWSAQLLIGGFLGVYTLSLGKGFGMMFYDVHFCLPEWTLVGCAVVLPFVASARKLGTWASLIWINCATILATVVIPLVVMSRMGVEATRAKDSGFHAVADLSPSSVFTGLNIMVFSFTSQFMIVEIMSEMKDVKEFPHAYLGISAPFQAVVFLVCGLGGYYFRGDQVAGIITDSMPFGFWFRMSAFCLVIHMVITWVIKGIVFCNALLRELNPDIVDDHSKGWNVWAATVAAVMAAAYLLAQVVPFFVDLIDLLGSSLTPLVCFLIPVAMYYRVLKDYGGYDDVSTFEWVVIAIEVVLSLILMFVGTFFAIQNILHSWRTYGYPFDCHCQNLWNTCECSGSHAGMEHCDNALFLYTAG